VLSSMERLNESCKWFFPHRPTLLLV